MQSKRPNSSRLWVLALLIIVAPACLREGSHGVGMKRVTSDLIYGVPPLSEVAAPPGLIAQEPESFEPEPDFTSSFRSPSTPPPAVQQCPEAGPNDFPSEPAPNSVTTKPKQGLYVWKLDGTQKVAPFPFPFRLSSFTDRSVEGVQDFAAAPGTASGTNFTFSTKQRDPSLNSRIIITQDFRVDQTNPSPQLRGILLTRVHRQNPDGTSEVFTPSPPVQFLPLPIQIGPSFETSSVDVTNPQRIQTLTHRGFVKERKRVDACGTVIDSWLIDAEQIGGAGSDTTRRKYDYSIAPHLGGLIVFEHSERPCPSTVEGRCSPPPADQPNSLAYDANIAQTEPDPPGSR